MNLPDIEKVAEKVHEAWMQTKTAQGFHTPIDCKSANHTSYINSPEIGREKFADAGLDEKTYKWCEKCHACLYPYSQLSEQDKDLDRSTVQAVYAAIHSLQ